MRWGPPRLPRPNNTARVSPDERKGVPTLPCVSAQLRACFIVLLPCGSNDASYLTFSADLEGASPLGLRRLPLATAASAPAGAPTASGGSPAVLSNGDGSSMRCEGICGGAAA